MGEKMTDVFRIADILISHAVRVHGNKIALIVYYGSYARGTARSTSDLDIYYVPDDGEAESLRTTFVIGGLPFEFDGMPWKALENIANAKSRNPWAVSASEIADAKVLYYRSEADLERFNALKARIAELVRSESRGYMVERGLEEFKTTLFQLGQMRLAIAHNDMPGLHWAGWQFTCCAVNCLALVNQTYFSKGWGANMPQILALRQRPADLETMLNGILQPQSPDQVMEQADQLALQVHKTLLASQASLAEPSEAKEAFVDFYFDVHEYKTKVLSACERGDRLTASAAAFALQQLICELMNKVDKGFFGTDFNLLGEYLDGYLKAGFPDLTMFAAQGDLPALARQVQLLDEKAKEWFTSRSVELNILENEAALLQLLNRRDPARN
ncbi:MAG: nucleotidyltransferase domain-containing protein [Anaerolineales bacterium]|nr:nucleotidyltransferase domain-containing protein [Anaerolineales bacterium]